MKNVTIEELIDIFEEVVDLSGGRIDENALLGDDIPVDSGDMLRVISRVEAKYSFKFEPEEILRLKTLGDFFEIVRSKAGKKD